MPEREYEGFTPDPVGFTPDPPASSSSWTDDIFTIPNALRFGGSALGTVAGGLATGGLGAGAGMFAGGAAGEAAARWWEGKEFDPSITALEGALNLLPGGGAIPGKGAALKQVGKYALRQAGHGAWQGAAGSLPRHQAEAGNLWSPSEWEMPSAREIGTQTVAGGVIGGGTGGTLGAAASRFGKARPAAAPPPLDVTGGFEHPPIRETFTRPPDTSARDIGEGESILDYISADQPVQRAAPITPEPTTPQPQGAFDPNSLTGLRRTEVEFVDPTTGEVRSSADARPGDVPVMNEPAAPAAPKPTVESWMDELIRGESGEFDPNALLRNLTGRGEEPTAGVPAAAARAARVDPNIVLPQVRTQIDAMGDEYLQRLINDFEGNPTAYGESGRNAALYGRDVLEERQTRRSTLMDQFAPATAPRQEAPANRFRVSDYTRREIDGRSDEELLDFIRRHTDAYQRSSNPSGDISRGLAEYATSVAESRGLEVPRTQSAEAQAFTRDVEGELPAPPDAGPSPFAQPIPDNVPLQRESYAEIANAIRRMTGEEATAYVNENSSSLNPTDIQPMIDELMSESPTSGSRAAVRFLESRLESQQLYHQDRDLLGEPVQIPRSRFDVEPTTSHTGGEDEIRPPVSSRITDTVEQVRGMTAQEVRASMGSGDYREIIARDIPVLLRELERNPTEGTRALISEINSRLPEHVQVTNRTGGELPVKPPVEVTPEMRERSRKRLAAIGGAERAEKLVSGEVVVGSTERAPYRPRTRRGRPNTAEKISPETAAHWNEWGDRQIANYVQADPAQPEMTVQPPDQMFPKHLKIHYRDAQGNPIGYLESDYAGHGITTLAVSSKLGLRRGKIAFTMLKEAMDRGITEPSGPTSDWTKNLIDRVKSIVRGEEGELDIDAIVKSLNEIMSGVKASKFGQSVGKLASRFAKEESGAMDFDEMRSRFSEIRQGKGSGVKKPLPEENKITEIGPRKKEYQDIANRDRITMSGVRPEAGVPIEHDPKLGGFQEHVRGNKHYITHPMFGDKVKGPFNSGDETTDFVLEVQDSPEFDRYVQQRRISETPGQGTNNIIRRFIEEEEGSVDLGRLQELFQKKQDGTITPEELAEAKAIATEAKAAPAAETPAPVKTGQVTWSNTRKKKPAAATTTPATALPRAASLPAELAGAKPRFNIGADSYSPSFADDLDKALFIIAQKTRSKSDAKYLQFVMEQTGMDEQSARLAAQGVRNTIKNQLSGAEPGVVRIESIWRKNQEPAATAAAKPVPKVSAQEAGTGTVAKAANEKPAAVAATPEQAVAVAQEAEQAAASLANRLKRAVENPNPANSAQEIEELLDEAAESINKIPDKDRAGWIRKILGGNKALLTAWDLSAPGRQGKAFILNKAWWTSLNSMRKAWGSDKAANTVMQSIINHPSGYFKPGPPDKFGRPTKSYAEKMGLDLAGVEEVFGANRGSAFDKYSGVARSSRAHTAFLNKLRSDQFVAMVQSAEKLGLGPKNDLNQVKTYAKFINDATGRGSLNVGKWKLERNLGAINDVMFAPKNLSGQIRTWNAVLNPMKYASYDPVMRNQALRSLFAIAGTGLAVGELSRLMGGKIVDDPTSSDFRKIRVGDTRIDLFGGYQQFPVAAMKFLMNAETPTSGRNAGRRIDFSGGGAFRNRATVAERFFTNRLSPAGSFVWAWMNNREFDGKPFEVKRALYERTAPIVLKDLYELAKDDPALAAIMTPSNVLGLTGTQTYGRN